MSRTSTCKRADSLILREVKERQVRLESGRRTPASQARTAALRGCAPRSRCPSRWWPDWKAELDPQEVEDRRSSSLNYISSGVTPWADRLKLEHGTRHVCLGLKRLTVVTGSDEGVADTAPAVHRRLHGEPRHPENEA